MINTHTASASPLPSHSLARPPLAVPVFVGRTVVGAAKVLGAIIVVVTIAACSGVPTPVPYARPYPDAKQSRTLNIQVFRSTKHLELTNTTAQAFGPCTLWLNARFSRPIGGLGVGQSLRLPLEEFRDEYSDVFRGGGFFSTEAPDRLVLAQIESLTVDDKADLIGLVVVKGEDE